MAVIDRLRRKPTPEEVVRDHAADVARQLKRIFGPAADIDDVFQAVFVEVIRSLDGFQGRSKLKTWIHRITLNVAYQEMRMQYRDREHRAFADVETLVDLRETSSGYDRAEARRALYQGLAALAPKKRIAVVLHDVEGYTLKEIGEAVGRPLQTVASQLRAGRAELAVWFEASQIERPTAASPSPSVEEVQL